jgi:hypothetical protein
MLSFLRNVTKGLGVGEILEKQDATENIWAEERYDDRSLEKTA